MKADAFITKSLKSADLAQKYKIAMKGYKKWIKWKKVTKCDKKRLTAKNSVEGNKKR